MAYVRPLHPVFDDFPIAHGPGIFADEADSALPDLVGELDYDTLHRLAELGSVDLHPPAPPPLPLPNEDAPRANPSDPDEEEDGFEGRITAQRELMKLAKLTTGVWGTDANPTMLQRGGGRDKRDFFERMRELSQELEALHKAAERRYRERGGSTARPWLVALDKMHEAVRHVLSQEHVARPSLFKNNLPFGLRWGVIAAKGNKKLPFAAYSELPMASCLGAGACAVYPDNKKKGWCYSFKAWRYPDGFARQFFNTLANYADREFAIRHALGRGARSADEAVEAALSPKARAVRGWPGFVKGLALRATRRTRFGTAEQEGKVSFLRLFVDGDVGPTDCVVEWMDVCRDVDVGGASILEETASSKRMVKHLEVYGYTKCWPQFLEVHALLQAGKLRYHDSTSIVRAWPNNYTVNMSSGSVYHVQDAVRREMELLPVTRGYFEAINLSTYIRELSSIDPEDKIELPAGPTPFAFSEQRIRDFLRLNHALSQLQGTTKLVGIRASKHAQSPVRSREIGMHVKQSILKSVETKVREVVSDFQMPSDTHSPGWIVRVRKQAFRAYLHRLLDQRQFGQLVRRELAKDQGYGGKTPEKDYLEARAKEFYRAMRKEFIKAHKRVPEQSLRERSRSRASSDEGLEKALSDKALALVLHEVLWTLGKGGTCPLVCGNCSDTPGEPGGLHRCASKVAFRGQTIHTGLH